MDRDLGAGGGGGTGVGRQRGTQMFMLSTSADPDNAPHVAIAGTSSHLHPSDRGSLVPPSFPTYRGSGTVAGADGTMALRPAFLSSGSHSPLHSRPTQDSHGGRRDSVGGGLGLVPAEAESAPEGMIADDPLSTTTTGVSMRGGSRHQQQGSSSSSSLSSRSKRSSRRDGGRSSRRRSRDAGGGVGMGMRPAMPAAGPTDEMRPSPGPDDPRPPGPWLS